MKYRKLGRTGLDVSEIGFGAWEIGGGLSSYGPIKDDVSRKTLQFAFDNGINFFDTSDSYGEGHSEELIGETLRNVREEIILASKVGCLPHSGREMIQDFSVNHIIESVDASLKRLQTDYIDLYQLHSPPIDVLSNSEILATLKDLQNKGLIKAIGISVRSPNDALLAIDKYNFDCIQVNLNLIDLRAIRNGLLDLAEMKNIGIIVRTPLCFGFLTGKYSEKTLFKKNDHRLNWPKQQLKTWSDSVKLFKSIYESKNMSPTQFALKFCLSYKNVSTTIPGMKHVQEVKENIIASDLKDLSKDELTLIDKIYESNVFFDDSLKRSSHHVVTCK